MKPGHTVQFTGLKGAAHLNGTEGTLVRFDKAQQRWAVRCDADRKIVNARPSNLVVVQHESEAPPPRRRNDHRRGHYDYGGGGGDSGGGDGPTFGSVLAAAQGADCREEYYLRTLLALAQQGPQPEAQELVVEAIEELVNAGAFDGDKGERFVKHLHRRTREEDGTTADILGFIDTVVLAKVMNRLPTKGGRPVIPQWLRGSLAGSMSFNASMAADAGATVARKTASDITRVVDGDDSDDDDMEIPNISED